MHRILGLELKAVSAIDNKPQPHQYHLRVYVQCNQLEQESVYIEAFGRCFRVVSSTGRDNNGLAVVAGDMLQAGDDYSQ